MRRFSFLKATHQQLRGAVIFLFGSLAPVSKANALVKPICGTRSRIPRDSRTDYKIVLDGSQWMLDPANPHLQSDGTGDNNVLTMPDFKVTDFTERREGVPTGTLTDWIPFESKVMGTTVDTRVYPPQL